MQVLCESAVIFEMRETKISRETAFEMWKGKKAGNSSVASVLVKPLKICFSLSDDLQSRRPVGSDITRSGNINSIPLTVGKAVTMLTLVRLNFSLQRCE
jgi:hypothetical protein